jgi:hypothetical protein
MAQTLGVSMDFSIIIDFAANFALGNPKLVGICAIAYMVGLGAKILRDAIEKFILESPSKSDDIALDKAKQTSAYKIANYVLDFLFRLKKPSSK